MSGLLTVFMHAPPEHVAHVINASCLYAGLKRIGVNANWVTMNPRQPSHYLNPTCELLSLGLSEFVSECDVTIRNIAPFIQNEFCPTAEELADSLLESNCPFLYMHYYPPFWGPVVRECHRKGVCVGFHVQRFDRKFGDSPFYHANTDALEAIKHADFLTVSQDADKFAIATQTDKDPDKILVMPKPIPPDAFNAACRATPEPRQTPSTIVYIGRLERFKNLSWFLEECMPTLARRWREFQVHLIGLGTVEEEVLSLASRFPNVRVHRRVLSYTSVIREIRNADLILFPSGFDYSPRLPLEAIAAGTAVLMGRLEFNRRYFPYATYLIPQVGEETDILEYSNQTVTYAILDKEETIAAIQDFLDNKGFRSEKRMINRRMLQESAPKDLARRLLDFILQL